MLESNQKLREIKRSAGQKIAFGNRVVFAVKKC